MIEWLRIATNALEQEDTLSNNGLNNFFLNYNRCFLAACVFWGKFDKRVLHKNRCEETFKSNGF